MAKELKEFLKEKTTEITQEMGLESEVAVEEVQEGQIRVTLNPKVEEDTPLLIGFHGQTLNALQTILRTLSFKEFPKEEELPAVVVEAGGYRQKREEELNARAYEAADKARFLLKEVSFPAMSSYERRLIHTALGSEKGVYTQSRGEGRERHIVVIPGERPVEEEKK
ncbi:MAG: R3H domain-containing nucleic acid-binding protein [Patescibacteria group bacterium]